MQGGWHIGVFRQDVEDKMTQCQSVNCFVYFCSFSCKILFRGERPKIVGSASTRKVITS